MTLFLPTLAVAYAAFCVWLTVRIVNRRERWAKWTLAATVGVPVLYVLSFGPACWITSRRDMFARLASARFALRVAWPADHRFPAVFESENGTRAKTRAKTGQVQYSRNGTTGL